MGQTNPVRHGYDVIMASGAEGNDVGARASHSPRRGAARSDIWSVELTRNIGRQIRYWRRQRKLTTQRLSDLTAKIGQRIPPTVLTNLEHQRRDYVSVSELLLIAAALNVPPVLLIAPIGQTEEIESLPANHTSPWRIRGWLMGAIPLQTEGFDLEEWNEATTAIKLYDSHRLLFRSYQEAARRLKQLDDDRMDIFPGRQWPEESLTQRRAFRSALLSQLATYLAQLRTHRKTITDMGLVLPALPPDVETDLSQPPLERDDPPDIV